MPQRPQSENDNDPLGVEVGVLEVRDQPGTWLVEAVDYGSEGEIYRALFEGPRAEETARSYAAAFVKPE